MDTKRIMRSRDDRMIAGVASGLARYFNTDPLFVRLGFVLLAFFQGFGVLLYFVLWLLLPNEGSQTAETRDQMRENVNEMRGAAESLVDRVRGMFNS